MREANERDILKKKETHGARRKSNFRSHVTGWVGFLRLCKDSGIWVFMPSAKNMAQKMYQYMNCVIFTGTSSVVRALNGRECGAYGSASPSSIVSAIILTIFCEFFDERSKSAVFAPV